MKYLHFFVTYSFQFKTLPIDKYVHLSVRVVCLIFLKLLLMSL